jgi:hypothetical protein
MDSRQQRLTGTVVRKTVSGGSKSEHEAVVLCAPDGEYVLRRAGGNAFSDPELDRLVGASISAEGLVRGRTFIMTRWTIADGSR